MPTGLCQADLLFLLPEGHDKAPEVVGLYSGNVMDATHEAIKIAHDAPGMLDGFFALSPSPSGQGIPVEEILDAHFCKARPPVTLGGAGDGIRTHGSLLCQNLAATYCTDPKIGLTGHILVLLLHWKHSELVFERKGLIPALQQLLI